MKQAITQIRRYEANAVSGMSAMVTDLKALCEQEEPIYVGLAVLFATIAMMLFLDSWILPFIFLASIGMAYPYNLGKNFMLEKFLTLPGVEISRFQLAVTMDYSSTFHGTATSEENVILTAIKKRLWRDRRSPTPSPLCRRQFHHHHCGDLSPSAL